MEFTVCISSPLHHPPPPLTSSPPHPHPLTPTPSPPMPTASPIYFLTINSPLLLPYSALLTLWKALRASKTSLSDSIASYFSIFDPSQTGLIDPSYDTLLLPSFPPSSHHLSFPHSLFTPPLLSSLLLSPSSLPLSLVPIPYFLFLFLSFSFSNRNVGFIVRALKLNPTQAELANIISNTIVLIPFPIPFSHPFPFLLIVLIFIFK